MRNKQAQQKFVQDRFGGDWDAYREWLRRNASKGGRQGGYETSPYNFKNDPERARRMGRKRWEKRDGSKEKKGL